MRNWNLIFRRSHLYLGLILLPWMVIYAVSTALFNHGKAHGHGGPAGGDWERMWQKSYTLEIPASQEALRETARRVVEESDLTGPFGVQKQGGRLLIALPRFVQPARLIYDPVAQTLTAERRTQSSTGEILARLHTRTGYNRGGAMSVVWASLVDLYCVATFVWVGTGIYLWWKLAFARTWGFVALFAGMATLGVLLFTV